MPVLLALLAMLITATPATEAPLRAAIARVVGPRSPAQRVAIEARESEVAFMGRRYGGKSLIVCIKALMFGDHFAPPAHPAARMFICREERASMQQTTIYSMREEVLGPELWAAMYHAGTDELVLPNGSNIAFSGLDKPGRILGARYAFMGIDQAEQIDEDQFSIAQSGCMQDGFPWTQLLLAFNPDNPEHWAYQRYQPDLGDGIRPADETAPRRRVVLVKEDDFISDLTVEKRDRLERMSGVWKDRLRYGRWVAFTGTVLDLFSPSIHIVDAPESWAAWGGYPPPNWRRLLGIDFGYNPDPWAAVWIAKSPDGRFYVYRQDMRTKLTPLEQAARINRWEHVERAHLKACAKRQDLLAGPAERNHWRAAREWLGSGGLPRSAYSDHETDVRAMYAQAGVASWPADKEVFAGIETLRDLLNPGQPGGPRLFIVRDRLVERDPLLRASKRPTCAEEEVSRYVWATKKTAGGAKVMKDRPAEGNDHAWDAIRYALHSSRRNVMREVIA